MNYNQGKPHSWHIRQTTLLCLAFYVSVLKLKATSSISALTAKSKSFPSVGPSQEAVSLYRFRAAACR